jgi:regulatory protein
MEPARKRYSAEEAKPKLYAYCAYQERCHSEVKEKLYSYGLYKNEVEELISQMVEENYLNEERFAIQFASGKFRIKQWGKIKIKYQLKQKQVSEYCIKKALAGIDGTDYDKTLARLAAIKLKSLRTEKNIFIKKKKLQDYLRMKGYETDLVSDAVNKILQ